jgi:DNA-directed RNA polymerase subunit A'
MTMQAEIIDHLRFTVISPAMIKRMSVAKLIVPDTYNEDGYPIDGGLIDQRLGVIDPGLKCKTCGGRVKSCPGHFGHIDLVRPVIHSEFAKMIYLLLQSTCFSCHRLLLTQEQVQEIRPIIKKTVEADEDDSQIQLAEEAIRELLFKKLKSSKKCPHCGTAQRKLKLERPTFFYIEGNKMKPDEIHDWLAKISDDDVRALGMDPEAARPEWLVLTSLLVPPVNVRPSITLETGERSEDDLTHKLVDIMRINQRLEQDIDAGAPQIIIDDLWELLQYHVTVYFNNETPGVPVARHRSTRPLKTLAQRLKGKEGRLRYNLSGKRVNFSARTVISGDASLTINQVGIPIRFAEGLTVPFYVTQWNIEKAKELLQRTGYPAAVNLITKEGIRKRIGDANKEELLKELQPGYVLERQLEDHDIVLMNRQPTLHRLSIMAHEVKVLPGRTLRIHVSVTSPYGADFDGDEMNLHVPQSLEAQAEERYLMQPKNLILSARDGRPTMFIEEDEIIGVHLLTKDDSFFSKDDASIMLSGCGIYELPKPERNGTYSGKAIFSMLLPKTLNFEHKSGDQQIVIKKGELLEGTISEKLVGQGGGTLILAIFQECGADFTEKFLLNIAKLSLRVAYKYGVTIGIGDYYLPDAIEKEGANIIAQADAKVHELLKSYRDNKLESLPGYTVKQTLEIETMAELEAARTLAIKALNKHVPPTNMAKLMVMVRARGNIQNFVQTSMFLGQQAVRAGRPKRGFAGRILPYFKKGDRRPEVKGFIHSSFFTGLTPADFYMHAMGARDSAMSKSLVTAVSGYLQRRLINALQDIYVDDGLAVKDASGALIQSIYGGDGKDPMKEKVK